jgi:hypothetical protein
MVRVLRPRRSALSLRCACDLPTSKGLGLFSASNASSTSQPIFLKHRRRPAGHPIRSPRTEAKQSGRFRPVREPTFIVTVLGRPHSPPAPPKTPPARRTPRSTLNLSIEQDTTTERPSSAEYAEYSPDSQILKLVSLHLEPLATGGTLASSRPRSSRTRSRRLSLVSHGHSDSATPDPSRPVACPFSAHPCPANRPAHLQPPPPLQSANQLDRAEPSPHTLGQP